MNLQELKPGFKLENPSQDLPDLLGYILTRIQFVPHIRHSLGWRGMVQSTKHDYSWTAKVDTCQGVFGVYLDEVDTNVNGWAQATYRICYFPDTDERITERFSSAVKEFVEDANYAKRIREFTSEPEMAAAFEVGNFTLASDFEGKSLILGMHGLTRRHVVISEVSPLANHAGALLISHVDEYLPAFTIAFQLFKALAASMTFVLGESPKNLARQIYSGWRYSRTSDNQWHTHPDNSQRYNNLTLCYGAEYSGLRLFPYFETALPKIESIWRGQGIAPSLYSNALWWNAHDLETLNIIDKRSLGIEDRPQLYVLSGFLGSGKTSFLQNFLEYQMQHHRFVAVIQNEVGEESVDGKLLDNAYTITELNAGTVCCSLAGELRPSLEAILSNFQPDIIVLETSGAANPIGLQADVRALEDLVRFDSITTIIDAEKFEQSQSQYEVVADQVTAADVIVMNKTDLVSESHLTQIGSMIQKLNPHALQVPATHGAVNPGVLYEFGFTTLADEADNQHKDSAKVHSHSQNHDHKHDELNSHKITCSNRLNSQQLVTVLEGIPASVFRIKGIVDLVGRGPTLVQFVGGRFNLSEYQNPNVTDRFLVLIGQNLNPVIAVIEQLNFAHSDMHS